MSGPYGKSLKKIDLVGEVQDSIFDAAVESITSKEVDSVKRLSAKIKERNPQRYMELRSTINDFLELFDEHFD